MEPPSDETPARAASFSHSLTSPAKHPAGPRRQSTEPAHIESNQPTRSDRDDPMAEAPLLPPAAPRPRSSVPSPPPRTGTAGSSAEPDVASQATTSPYFTSDPSSSTGQYGSKYTTVVYPTEHKGQVEHVEHAPTHNKPASPMELDNLPDYQDVDNTTYDDKSAQWASGGADYRSPEALPPSPVSNNYQPAVQSWGEGVTSGGTGWQMPPTDGPYGSGGWDDIPPPLVSIAEVPQVAQVGSGILPSSLIEPPAWSITSPAWEILVEKLPEPGPTPPPPPPRPLPPTGELIPDGITREGSPAPATLYAETPSSKIDPPTLQEIRDALPAPPPGGGSVIFSPTDMSWWVCPSGQGSPSADMLTEAGELRVAEFVGALGESRKGRAGMDSESMGSWDDTKKAPHLHLIESAIRLATLDDISVPVVQPSETVPSAPDLMSEETPPLHAAQEDANMEPAVLVDASQGEPSSSSLVPTEPSTPTRAARIPPQASEDRLYISANDQTWVVVPKSPARHGVLNPTDVEAFTKNRSGDAPPGVRDGPEAAWVVILTMISNFLFNSQTQAIKVINPNFATKVGWNETSERILNQLGFETNTQGNVTVIAPRPDPASLATMRSRLLRAWVEVSVYLEAHRQTLRGRENTIVPIGGQVGMSEKHAGYVKLIKPEDGQFGEATGLRSLAKRERRAWQSSTYTASLVSLGLNTEHFSVPAPFVIFAYDMQVRFDNVNTPRYLEALSYIAGEWPGVGQDDLQTHVVTERSRGLFPQSEIDAAYEQLPMINKQAVETIGVDREQLPHDYISKAFWDAHAALNDDGSGLSQKKKDLIQALEIIAFDRKADQEVYTQLAMVVEQAKRQPPSTEEAYKILGLGPEMDDDMVLVLYDIRLSDTPGKIYDYRDALRSIANARNSDALRRFLDTGLRADVVPQAEEPVSADRPVGLNNVGNTCYLNSLLQYFYTIRELRETVSNCSQFKEELKDDAEGEAKRVGGRAVSKKEIERSIRFTDYLSGLFSNLEFSDTSSISPDLELAYLALVTSKDEEADEPVPPLVTAATSDDTDTTLVDDANPPPAPSNSPLPITAEVEIESAPLRSVLGKRTSEDRDLMDVDSRPESRSSTTIPEEVDSAMNDGSDHSTQPSLSESPVVSPSVASHLSPGRKTLRQDSIHSASRSARAMTIEPEAAHPASREPQVEAVTEPELNLPIGPIALPEKPPLPPRPVPKASADGPMMFGKQHDVSECLDNCLFQIEAAMDPLKLQGGSGGGANLVKELFYGKARQTLHFEGDLKASTSHDKEVIFNHVLLNVGETGTTKDLYDGLSDYYTPELVDIDGKKASIEEVPVEFPRLLHVQLQRAQFDRETARAYKSNAFLSFPETLRMDRYSEDADPVKREASRAKTTEIKACRERIDALKNSGKQPFTEAIATLVDDVLASPNWLQSAHIDDDLKKDLDSRRGDITSEILATELDVKRLKEEVEAIWEGDSQLEYELASVFMHRGDASFGHYYLYQRNLPNEPETFFKYNDNFVTRVPASEVLADTTGTNANPYLLVYARKGLNLVDTVKRTLIV